MEICRAMSYETILYEERDRIAWITLNRPEALNAIDTRTMTELRAAVDRAETSDAVRVLVLSGTGRAFCAGADLKHVKSLLLGPDVEAVRRYMTTMRELLVRVEQCEKPLIVGVNGIALAAGLGLMLCADLVVAVEHAQIGDGHANYAVLPGGGTSARLPRKVGPMRAKELLYCGGTLSAETAKDWGLINEIAPAGGLADACIRLAESLAAKSPLVLRRLKRLIDDGLEVPKAIAFRNETAAWEAHALANDLREGLTAFAEKRAPDYTGT
jgi:enoyl-CoA hydratase/carnithine racemase